MSIAHPVVETVHVAGIDVHLWRGGNGPPLLLFQDDGGNPQWLRHHQALAEHFTVYAPEPSGFWLHAAPGMDQHY